MLSHILKEQTQTLHDTLENNPFMQKMRDQSFAMEDYQQLLKLFYLLHHMCEAQLFEYDELEMSLRERLSALGRDLDILGCEQTRLKAFLNTDLELKIDTLSKAYGALYVLEGSRMGGIFLASMIKQALGEDVPVHYFEGLKEKTPAYVMHFKEQLNQKAPFLDEKECIQCAKELFIFVEYLFTCKL